jgi:hypothetical protein
MLEVPMLAWLPSLITLIVSVLTQLGAPDLINQNPKVAVSLITLAAVINHLLPSPVSPHNHPPGGLRSFLWIVAICLLFSVSSVYAQTVTVDLNKAKLAWDVTPAVPPLDGNPDSFNAKCGKVTKTYTTTTPINDPLARSVAIKQIIPTQGLWFCAVTAVNRAGESPPSNEVSFDAGAVPASPVNLRVQAQ